MANAAHSLDSAVSKYTGDVVPSVDSKVAVTYESTRTGNSVRRTGRVTQISEDGKILYIQTNSGDMSKEVTLGMDVTDSSPIVVSITQKYTGMDIEDGDGLERTYRMNYETSRTTVVGTLTEIEVLS